MDTDLLPFSPAHAAVVAGWPRSAAEVLMWCGERAFPLPARRVAEWQREEGVRGRVLVVDGAPAGYGELWFDDGENSEEGTGEGEVELARIIVAPAARGRGLGRALVRGLLAEALDAGRPDVFLRVHPDNAAALRCYRGAGFVPVAAEWAAEWNAAQPVAYTWLRRPRPHDHGPHTA
ncbi:MAG TPA: GNAT family N-acetyltransferase [Streptomyces sp.]|uniref:GNAT family N-acetyltransferase n=1 Tax=Streptomyces sp. TaxID=1931 RepID=UPI002D5671D1|nr:GNAT family N-acetyltransferase [Streptomyces sp.]HZG04563.1 GNAT family N-acetyltransferase [Streptomyces sp.]